MFGGSAYQRRSEHTSQLLGQLFDKLRGEGIAVSYTMEDFTRQYVLDHFEKLTPAERRKALKSLTPEERGTVLRSMPAGELLTWLSAEQVQQLRDQLLGGPATQPRKSRRKK